MGSQATLSNAAMFGEFIFASSVTPPAKDSGPIESTLHRMSSLDSPTAGSNSLGFVSSSSYERYERSVVKIISHANKPRKILLKNTESKLI